MLLFPRGCEIQNFQEDRCGEWFEAGMLYPGSRVPVRQNFAKIENETLFLTIGLNYQRECIQI